MAVRKLSVALEKNVASMASRAAKRKGTSLSAWLSRAARHELALERGLRGVEDWEREHGILSADELRRADATLDRLLGGDPPKRSGRRSVRRP